MSERIETAPFERIIASVDLNRGYISVGFLEQTEAERALIRQGRTNSEYMTTQFAENLVDIEAGRVDSAQKQSFLSKLRNILVRLLPTEIAITAVRTYTSELKFKHCELGFFMNEEGQRRSRKGADMLAVAINEEFNVYIAPRHFSADFKWVNVRCSPIEMYAMLHYAHSLQGTKLCRKRMAQLATYPGPDRRDQLYCSHLTMACLQYIGTCGFHLNRPNTLTIDEVYMICAAEENRPVAVPRMSAAHMDAVFGGESRTRSQAPLSIDDKRRFGKGL